MSESGSSQGYTVEDAASRLGIKPDEVHGLIAAGALQASGSGDALRVTDESVVMYMMARASSMMARGSARPGPLAIAGDILLPLLLTLWFMAAVAEVYSLRGGKVIVPVPAAVAVLAAVLGFSWWLARQATDFSSVRGVGTALYGRRVTHSGRIGTQWVTFGGVPLLPVRSYVVLEAGVPSREWIGSVQTTKFRLRPLPGIHWPQALPVLGGVWAGVAVLIALALRR